MATSQLHSHINIFFHSPSYLHACVCMYTHKHTITVIVSGTCHNIRMEGDVDEDRLHTSVCFSHMMAVHCTADPEEDVLGDFGRKICLTAFSKQGPAMLVFIPTRWYGMNVNVTVGMTDVKWISQNNVQSSLGFEMMSIYFTTSLFDDNSLPPTPAVLQHCYLMMILSLPLPWGRRGKVLTFIKQLIFFIPGQKNVLRNFTLLWWNYKKLEEKIYILLSFYVISFVSTDCWFTAVTHLFSLTS